MQYSHAQCSYAGLPDRPTPVLPDALEALTLLFAKNAYSADTGHESSLFFYCCIGPVEEIEVTDQSCRMQLLHNLHHSSHPNPFILMLEEKDRKWRVQPN